MRCVHLLFFKHEESCFFFFFNFTKNNNQQRDALHKKEIDLLRRKIASLERENDMRKQTIEKLLWGDEDNINNKEESEGIHSDDDWEDPGGDMVEQPETETAPTVTSNCNNTKQEEEEEEEEDKLPSPPQPRQRSASEIEESNKKHSLLMEQAQQVIAEMREHDERLRKTELDAEMMVSVTEDEAPTMGNPCVRVRTAGPSQRPKKDFSHLRNLQPKATTKPVDNNDTKQEPSSKESPPNNNQKDDVVPVVKQSIDTVKVKDIQSIQVKQNKPKKSKKGQNGIQQPVETNTNTNTRISSNDKPTEPKAIRPNTKPCNLCNEALLPWVDRCTACGVRVVNSEETSLLQPQSVREHLKQAATTTAPVTAGVKVKKGSFNII